MDATSGEHEAAATAPQAAERQGPIELRRMRKDDGRALLVYRHAAGGRR